MSNAVDNHNAPIEKIAAVVVLYFPDLIILNNLLESLQSQVSKLYLICNGIDEQSKASLDQHHQYTQFIELENNPGLGKALNVGMEMALEDQIEYLFLFDQDSAPNEVFVQQMIGQLNQAKTIENTKFLTKADPKKVAAIGPSFYDARSVNPKEATRNQFKRDGRAGHGSSDADDSPIACDCLITSGMLIHLSQIRPGIFFDESYFVDHVDSEWCFRARAHGYAIYGSRAVSMAHRISDGKALHIGPLTFLSYSPIRRYWHYKNSVRLMKSPNTSLRWKLRLGGIMLISFLPNLFLDKSSWSSVKAMLLGAAAGFNSRPDL